MAGALWLSACYGSRASALSIWWLLPQFLKNLKKLSFFYSKRASSPAKTWSFAWKIENRPGKLSEGYLNRVNLYKTGYEHTAIIMQVSKINSMPNGKFALVIHDCEHEIKAILMSSPNMFWRTVLVGTVIEVQISLFTVQKCTPRTRTFRFCWTLVLNVVCLSVCLVVFLFFFCTNEKIKIG